MQQLYSTGQSLRGRATELIELGRMTPTGRKAFEARGDDRSAICSYEQKDGAELDHASELPFRANARGWDFFQEQPAWYRRTAVWSVISVRREETRHKRLATLIGDSEQGWTIRTLIRLSKRA